MIPNLKQVNLALRALMELGIVLGLGYRGFTTGNSTSIKILLGIGVPILVFGFWGLVDFHQAGWRNPCGLSRSF